MTGPNKERVLNSISVILKTSRRDFKINNIQDFGDINVSKNT